MCGITALLMGMNTPTEKHYVFNMLVRSLKALQNRGYDSCGILDSQFRCLLRAVKRAEMEENTKDSNVPDDAIDQISLHKSKFPISARVGIAHTRWATSGAKTVRNAHPHISYDNKLAVIHNGIIENYQKIRAELQSKGIKFRSETDTEVISNWIAYKLRDIVKPSISQIEEVLRDAQRYLEGTWSVAMIHKDHDSGAFLLKNGSPLLIGYQRSTGTIMAASEIAGFVNLADRYAILEDDEVLFVHRGQQMNEIQSNLRNLRFAPVPQEVIHITPNPFPHWMTKEIYDQPQAIEGPAEWGKYKDKTFSRYPELQPLFPIREKLTKYESFDVLLVACGTSYHAGLAGRWFFRSVPFRTVRVVVASEFTVQDLPKGEDGTPGNVIAIMISQSGETKDVHRALSIIKMANVPTIALVNVQDSLIARESDMALYLHAGREVAVASTKAYVSQLVGLKILAMSLQLGPEGKVSEDFFRLSDQIKETLKSVFPYRDDLDKGKYTFECPPKILNMALALNSKNHGFILSTGRLRAISYESALKIKEIGRVWVQGYPTGALKHGPFSLIEKGTPILFSLQDNDPQVRKRTESAIEEVHARGARVFVTTDIQDYENKSVEEIIQLPRNETFAPVLNIIPYQALSYYLSVIRGLDADKPVHLAKVVTTD